MFSTGPRRFPLQEAALDVLQAERHRLRPHAVHAEPVLLRVDAGHGMMVADEPQGDEMWMLDVGEDHRRIL